VWKGVLQSSERKVRAHLDHISWYKSRHLFHRLRSKSFRPVFMIHSLSRRSASVSVARLQYGKALIMRMCCHCSVLLLILDVTHHLLVHG
jgi:hypothetical protein